MEINGGQSVIAACNVPGRRHGEVHLEKQQATVEWEGTQVGARWRKRTSLRDEKIRHLDNEVRAVGGESEPATAQPCC